MDKTDQKNIQENKKFIDVEQVFAGKNPKLLRLIPRFLINYLKRIVHQDRLNAGLNKHAHQQGLEFVAAILEEFGVNVVIKGLENLSQVERSVIVSNHPLGGLDGMALMYAVGKVRPDIAIPANDFLLHLPNLRPLFIPVNKHGSNAENIKYFDETFSSDKTVLYFPAGLCSRKVKGEIIDLEWKKTFLSKAKKFDRDVIPVHISGRNSNFFYNLANLRKWLRLKANIEMLFLVDEMFKQENKDIVIIFGRPIPVEVFDKRMNDKKWTAKIQEHVYKLESNPDAEFVAE